jgi:hypothetical protein
MVIGRSDEQQNPSDSMAPTTPRHCLVLLGGTHLGQRPYAAQKAGHMTAIASNIRISPRLDLAPKGPFSNRVSLVNSLLLTSATVPGSRFSPRSEDIRRNIWSEAQALQCPQRAHVAFTRPNGLPRSQPAPSPRRATITSETRPGWILLKRGSGGRGLLGPAERLPRAPHAVQDY